MLLYRRSRASPIAFSSRGTVATFERFRDSRRDARLDGKRIRG